MIRAITGVLLSGFGVALIILGFLSLIPSTISGVYVGGDALANDKITRVLDEDGVVHVVAVMKDRRGFVSIFYPSDLTDGAEYVASKVDYVAAFTNRSRASRIYLHLQPCTRNPLFIANLVNEAYTRYGGDPRVRIVLDLEYVFIPARKAAKLFWGLPGLAGYTYLYPVPHLISYDGIYPYGEGPFEILFVAAKRNMTVPWHFFPQYDKTYNKLIAASWTNAEIIYDYASPHPRYQSPPTRLFHALLLATPGALAFIIGRRLHVEDE